MQRYMTCGEYNEENSSCIYWTDQSCEKTECYVEREEIRLDEKLDARRHCGFFYQQK